MAALVADSRARPFLPLLLLASLALLLLTSTAVSAHPRPHGSLPYHPSTFEARADLGSLAGGPHSPRPTPQPYLRSLALLMASKPNSTLALQKRATACYGSSTTVAQINALFASAGSSAGVLQFCEKAIITIDDTILFTASGQGLQTMGGNATALADRATLQLTGSGISTVVQSSNCVGCNDILVDSLIIDGGRVALGSLGKGALLELGGTSQRHTVTNCKLANTRGWSSLHIIEGSNLACSEAVIKNNVIGPSGESYGVGAIADGISLSCRNSVVQNNQIFDATDGAIVIFGSPGSDVSGNTITSTNSVLLGGINLVDYGPWDGDYTNTAVHGNTITASGAQIKIGIAQGPAIWGDNVSDFVRGGKVYSNVFGGTDMTFGLAVAGVNTSWQTTNNTALASARFRGAQGNNCHLLGATVAPTFALYDPSKTSGLNLGDDKNCFLKATVQYLLCYVASSDAGVPAKPAFVAGGTCTDPADPDYGVGDWKFANYCLRDSAANRTLVGAFEQTASNSVDYCTSKCSGLQYNYAGVENGNQCYCSNTISTGPTWGTLRDNCATPCPANSTQTCGGANYGLGLWYDASRVSAPVIGGSSVSSSASASPSASVLSASNGYTYLGCKADVSTYVLQGFATGSPAMTIDLCTSTCKSKGYAYAGLEYSTQCRCGVSLVTSNGGGGASTACTMTCAGSSTTICGGIYAFSLYSSSAIVASASSVSVAVTQTASSSAIVASASSVSVAVTLTTSSSAIVASSSSVSVAVTQTTSSSSPSSASAAPTPSSNGYAPLGCKADVSSYVLQGGYDFSSSSMTVNLCTSTCKSKLFAYAAVEYGSQCRCASSLVTSNGGGGSSTACIMPCSGDPGITCGGFYAMGLYYSSALLASVSASSVSAAAAPSASATPSNGWSAGTCLTDDGARLLTGPSLTSDSMTPTMCQNFCAGYTFSGTEYSTQCYCGNSIAATSSHGSVSTGCSSSCGGDASLTCGGSYAITVYTKAAPKWSSTTCVVDGDPRLLSAYSFDSSSMTNTLCQSTCESKGYIYAATEYSSQCYCSSNLATTSAVGIPSTGCNSACVGDSGSICGGFYAASLSSYA